VIGLEVHAQLSTRTKIYNADPVSFGDAPNTNVGVITLAHPGTLPKLNSKVIEYAIKMGLACNCEISRRQIFDRKNYFYPDLPKGIPDHTRPHSNLQGGRYHYQDKRRRGEEHSP
jgi:aspartyl-tRNA(Asn)/glutamyl-tRNA(Gln) amidotransferase subunit B